MAKEIEHKFLVKKKLLPKFKKLKLMDTIRTNGPDMKYLGCRELIQGYISRSPVVRVRIEGNMEDAEGPYNPVVGFAPRAFLTIKGKGCRIRDEFEFPIKVEEAKKMLKLCGKRKIRKIRHLLGPWEIDVFKGKHKGLILAEIELSSAQDKLPPLPDWIGKEVTYDPKYTNASLSEK